MNIQLIILLEILYFFNEHAIFTTMMSRIIFLPLAIFNLDGFKYSENRLIHRWQKYNNVFVIIKGKKGKPGMQYKTGNRAEQKKKKLWN